MKAIIFDLDGSLVDSEIYHRKAFFKAVKKQDKNLSYEKFMEFLESHQGKPFSSLEQEIKDKFIKSFDYNQASLEKKANYQIYIRENIETFPGVKDLLEEIAGKYKLAIASTSRLSDIEKIVKKIGLYDLFDFIISTSSVKKSKPYPDVFLYTADKLGIDIKDCLIIEDSLNGLLAARRSGASVLCFNSNKLSKDKLKDYQTFYDYRKMTLSDLVACYEKDKERK